MFALQISLAPSKKGGGGRIFGWSLSLCILSWPYVRALRPWERRKGDGWVGKRGEQKKGVASSSLMRSHAHKTLRRRVSHKSVNTRRQRRRQKQRKSPFDPFLSFPSCLLLIGDLVDFRTYNWQQSEAITAFATISDHHQQTTYLFFSASFSELLLCRRNGAQGIRQRSVGDLCCRNKKV